MGTPTAPSAATWAALEQLPDAAKAEIFAKLKENGIEKQPAAPEEDPTLAAMMDDIAMSMPAKPKDLMGMLWTDS